MAFDREVLLEEGEDTQHGRYLTFAVGEEIFGIEIRFVKEIIGLQPITKLPEVPDHIKGIINLRGKIIPVIDVRLKFKKEAMEYSDRTCIIVAEVSEMAVGIIVDNVAEVMAIEDEDIAPPPDARAGIQNKYLSGIGKAENEVKLLLNCEKLFHESDLTEINEIK